MKLGFMLFAGWFLLILSCSEQKVKNEFEMIDGIKLTTVEKEILYEHMKGKISNFQHLQGNIEAPDIDDNTNFSIKLLVLNDTLTASIVMKLKGEPKNKYGTVQKNLSVIGTFEKIDSNWYEIDANKNKIQL